MPQLLLEFFSEEIPARMQPRAEADLERLLMDKLTGAGFLPEGVKAFSTPRRIAAVVEGLPERQPDVKEERKGPRVGAPEKAVEGFLRGAGLSSIDKARVQKDPKGDFYVADIEKKGRETAAVVAEIVPEIIRAFPWPKSMRSGESDLYWVRPLQSILCAFDGEAVAVDVAGVPCGRSTEGHRFHAPGRFDVRRFDDYRQVLFDHRVVLEREERKRIIAADAKTQCQARGLELVEDPGLLDEVAGLVEWPVVIVGDMDPAFLDLPGEVIRLTMRTHQRYFAVRDPKTGKLAPHFVTVANVEAKDGGAAIAAGNSRVLSARLNDARFFWELDKKKGLEDPERVAKLDQIVFHQKLGSVGDKVKRIEALAVELAPIVGADVELVRRAARLCKADLVTETVGEFPELQGQIGRQLFEAAGPPASRRQGTSKFGVGDEKSRRDAGGPEHSIAVAIEDHYRPLGPSDRVPTDPVAICLALADKLDSLAGFWLIDEKPTGSSDPFALRRAALGAARILLQNEIRLPLGEPIKSAGWRFSESEDGEKLWRVSHTADLLAFLADRLKVQLREQGKRHDLVDAVFALGDDDLVRIVARVEALQAFLATEDGANLLAGYKRAANILAAEEKKGKGLTDADRAAGIEQAKLIEPQERALFSALEAGGATARNCVEKEDFAGAMGALSRLRGPVDSFFDKVLVNAEDVMLRRNRLLLLSAMRDALHAVADFSKIEG